MITGYSLTFATLLIIGGRLGDIFGHRRMFVLGATIFGVGSLLASISTSVPTLFVGEALIEGIGASMMIPATLSILSTTFKGAERPKAFAAWGAVAGAAVAFGPILGGLLTTDYSWRWGFRINVIVAPIIVIGALLFMRPDERSGAPPAHRRARLGPDRGRVVQLDLRVERGHHVRLVAADQGSHDRGWDVWPATRAVSIIPFAFVLAVVVFTVFVVVERAMERDDRDPLFEFGQLRHLGFRYGLLTTMVLAIGQFGSAVHPPRAAAERRSTSPRCDAGEWMLPQGILIAIAAPIGGRLTRRCQHHEHRALGPRARSRSGCCSSRSRSRPTSSFLALLPGMIVFGLGVGFASSQLTNVILSDIDPDKAGVASGTNTTVRQVGLALGIATFASFIDASTRTSGSPTAVADGARPAMFFGAVVVAFGTALSFLIPRVTVARQHRARRSRRRVRVDRRRLSGA